MSEFGSAEMKAVGAVKPDREDFGEITRDLAEGHAENIKQAEAQAGQAKELAQLAKDIKRVETEMAAIQAALELKKEEAALVVQQEKMQAVAGTQAAEIHAKVIATREDIINKGRLALSPNLIDMDVAELEAALGGKQLMLSEFQTRKAELESKLPATGSI